MNDVIVVSGLPRSGTSLMMQMLAAGGVPILSDGTRSADVDNPRGYLEYSPVLRTRQNASWVSEAQGKAVKVVHLLLKDLPASFEYRVILMKRPMDEVLASQREMLRRLGTAGAGVSDERLGDLFRRQLAELKIWLASQRNFQMIEIDYLKCVTDPLSAARTVSAFVGRHGNETEMADVVDPTLYRKHGANGGSIGSAPGALPVRGEGLSPPDL